MTQAISPGLIPSRPGLEREEPEIGNEDDIPPDEGHASARPEDDEKRGGEDRSDRQVERE